MLRFTSITCALVLSACVIETGDEESTTSQAAMGCPSWGCGENSPVLGPYGNWWELNIYGAPNNEDISVIDFQKGWFHYQPQISITGELSATHSALPALTGSALQGGWFNLATPQGVYKITISKVNPKASSFVTFWVGPAAQIETYELTWSGPGGAGRVCGNAPARDSGEGSGHVWAAPLEAMFFTGDRYHGPSKRVTHSSFATTTGWFNIGCAGSVLAKLHLNRHTSAGSISGSYMTNAAQRQTMLKMYVSDVCGSGDAWTTAGTPLHFEQLAPNMMQLSGAEWRVESQWGPNGALCLDKHRKGSLYTNVLNAPNIIQSSCPNGQLPPPCNQDPADFTVPAAPFMSGAYIVSAVPSFVP